MSEVASHLPEEIIIKRKLQFFWLVDCSNSMKGRKISAVNQAIREVLPELKDLLRKSHECDLEMRALKFSDRAEWHVGPDPIPIDSFIWQSLECPDPSFRPAFTAIGTAIHLLCDELESSRMRMIGRRHFRPICVLISDGYCLEGQEEYERAIERLNSMYYGSKAIRLPVVIRENGVDLLKFANHPEIGLLKPEELLRHVKFIIAESTGPMGRSIGKFDLQQPEFESFDTIIEEDDFKTFD